MKEMTDHQFQSSFLTPYVTKLDAIGMINTAVAKANGFVDQRRKSLQAALKAVTLPALNLQVTTNGGNPLESESPEVTIQGKAPVEMRDLVVTIGGQTPNPPIEVEFSNTDFLGWSARAALPLGKTVLEITGTNSEGDPIGSLEYSVTVVTSTPPEVTLVSPDRVVPGELVTITGANFRTGLKVLFGSIEATEVSFNPGADPTQVTAVVPATVPVGPTTLIVRNPSGTESAPKAVTVIEGKHKFLRGDANRSGKVDITDAIGTLGFLFQGGEAPTCLDAADSDDSGEVNLTDVIYTLRFLFQGGPAIPAPYPTAGDDPTAGDPLDCKIGVE
jgi:hypothetical protein